jgi:hypothetical protein
VAHGILFLLSRIASQELQKKYFRQFGHFFLAA